MIPANQCCGRCLPCHPAGTCWKREGEDLRFEDASFELVTASWVLHILEPDIRQRVISEVHRVLKPGGRFGTITIVPPRSQLTRLLTAPARAAADRWPSVFIGLKPFDPESDLLAAGFSVNSRERNFRGYPALCVTARRS